MTDKITTHQRFLKKAEEDLVKLFKDGEYTVFAERFNHFVKMGPPDIRVEEMFYESLKALEAHDKIIDYSLMQLNEGVGDYETHMIELLNALHQQERYYEVINFSDHLMEENLPQGFRIEIASIRHKAKKAIDDLSNRRRSEPEPEPTDVDDIDLENMSHQQILRLFSTFADEKDIKYKEFVLEQLKTIKDKDIVTFMLLYLREIGYSEIVEHHKFDSAEKVKPVDLPVLEDVMIIKDVEPAVLDVLESQAPQIVSEATLLMTSHAIFSYPADLDFKAEELVDGYLDYILDLLNVDHSYNAKPEVIDWISHMEQVVTSTKT